jgi:hypothetical protein
MTMTHSAHRCLPALVALLCGCAANNQSMSGADEPEPACSFRSPTTCWSVAGRFPTRHQPQPPQPERIREDSSPVLAVVADSLGASPSR